MQPNKISLVSLVAGAILFFLPWIEVQCQGRTFIRQSGLQIATGSISIGDEFAKGAQKPPEGKGAPVGLIVLGSGIFLGLALFAAWSNVKDGVHEPENAGRLSLIAIALVSSQMVFGFPIDRGLRDEMKKSGGGPGGQSQDALAAAFEQQFKAAFQTKPQPALYLYLAALGVPIVMWLTASRRKGGGNLETTSTAQ